MATILVADDNSNIQKMVTLAMKDQGIAVVAVGNGEAAIRKLPDLHPDIVLADIFMPVRNGYELCEFIKQDARYAHIPVILLVGAFDPLDEREAQRVGADGVLKKPFVPPEPLISMVKAVLAKLSERLVPVAAMVAPAIEAADHTLSTSSAAPVAPPPEFRQEDFSSLPGRVDFGERERPVAFSQLLEAPAAEPEPVPEIVSPPETGLGEIPLWHGRTATDEPESSGEGPAWGGTATALPRPEDSALLQSHDFGTEELAAEESGADVVEAAEPVREIDRKPETSSSAYSELSVEQPPAATECVPAPPEERPSPFAPVQTFTESAECLAPGVYVEEIPTEMKPIPGVSEAPPPCHFVEELVPTESSPLPTPAETLRTDAVQSFGVPQPVNPELVEAVVARVLERMQPQILDIVTREILKPVVEALVRRELEKS